MAPMNLVPVNGTIQNISAFGNNCCQQQVTIRNSDGIQNFIIHPGTYVIEEIRLRPGMNVTAFYDANLPIPLIFPPQYQTVFIGRRNPAETIYAGNFDESLLSLDGTLQLNLGRSTNIVTSNGQPYNCSPGGQLLIVYYTTTTRSVPPQTTPRKVIVIC